MIAPSACPALVLNADFRPLSLLPLSTWSWQDALRAVLERRVTPVAYYDRCVRSPSTELRLPAVIALKRYISLDRPAPLTRLNLFLRDDFTCLFCGLRLAVEQLTFDHVCPRAQGGISSFGNLATGCGACNGRKADRTPEQAGMPLLKQPCHPTLAQLNVQARRHPPRFIRPEWVDYWTVELEP
ncbi:HNH endonuclease [Rhodovibrio sodomensis]|uniref:HNH endonuclease n=1 Tax=Rhodovibrio sodomensis TaxID=1088 RepID=A0ABS1DBV3_9PROT|nr:HNH endonuclease [Rhodovibrio sodomensis]MBK1667401.1 HNH endonuclease [Rhodovibrio sodomensis]